MAKDEDLTYDSVQDIAPEKYKKPMTAGEQAVHDAVYDNVYDSIDQGMKTGQISGEQAEETIGLKQAPTVAQPIQPQQQGAQADSFSAQEAGLLSMLLELSGIKQGQQTQAATAQPGQTGQILKNKNLLGGSSIDANYNVTQAGTLRNILSNFIPMLETPSTKDQVYYALKLQTLQGGQPYSRGQREADYLKYQREAPQRNLSALNSIYDVMKKNREMNQSDPDFKQREDIRGIKNELIKQEVLKSDEFARASLPSIDAFQSLKGSFYEGFEPIDIGAVTGRPLSEADLFDVTGAKMQQFKKVINSKLGKSPQAAVYLRNVEGFATLISRGGLGEKGTLTDKDRGVVTKMFNLALANKEESDVAFRTIETILAKPSLRAGLVRVRRLGDTIEELDLPFGIKERAMEAKEKYGFSDSEILESFLSNIDGQAARLK